MGAGETLLFTLCSCGAEELWAAYTAIALPLPASLAGHGVSLVILLSCEHSFQILWWKQRIRAAKGQRKANPLPRDAPIGMAAEAAASPAARACLPGAAGSRRSPQYCHP